MQSYGPTQMAESWRTVRKNTLQIAHDIPAEQYAFQAAPDTMSVGAMLAHLATYTMWATQVHFVDRKDAITGEEFGRYISEAAKVAATLTTKESIIDALTTHAEAFAAGLEAMTDAQLDEPVALPTVSKSRFDLLLGVKEHEMHHRGQLMLIERLIGIVPHLTRARQQRSQ